jgi:uncharacterized protein (DUF3820 family)
LRAARGEADAKAEGRAIVNEPAEGMNVIPFGKYKGRPVDEVLIDDPGYLQWLAGQDWFRAKFTILHQVIINRGNEPEETPDHNAMQVRFLDDEFCKQILRCARDETAFRERLRNAREHNLKAIDEALASEQGDRAHSAPQRCNRLSTEPSAQD